MSNDCFYIYMLKVNVKDIDNKECYYIGKTKDYKKRIINHISGNRKSANLLKSDKVDHILEIIEVHKYTYTSKSLNDKILDSDSSKIENNLVITKQNEDINTIFRGGDYLKEWSECTPSERKEISKEYKEIEKKYCCKNLNVKEISDSIIEELKEKLKSYPDHNEERVKKFINLI
ncbi:hypothetical protein RD055328_03320 [Companilactobacillus sp. RD055328]|uniref:GIY-YIG nuclease family protein n=1 Tax=Companilactobacillus sp. RD055328 TaxID=2916634 RepID=UPI001FC7BF1C|nr:GIY-YIG nuclease family protein [Companilactobacillus sp. RD055328]GKQ42409.1 hypothetical protein RD055328_03320 [Companilactobacillus sp. RD055328]